MTIPTPSAWRYTHQDETMRIIGYSYEDVKPKNCNHPNYVGMFTAGQLNEYGQTCFDEGVRSIHTLETEHTRVLAAYELTVENLTAERDTQSKAADHWMGEACAEHNRNIDLSTGFDALAERVNALEADAERYRWLKPRLLGADFDWNEEGNCVLVFEMPNDATVSANCDETIDAAIKGARQAGVQ